jgi:hypothetical protein
MVVTSRGGMVCAAGLPIPNSFLELPVELHAVSNCLGARFPKSSNKIVDCYTLSAPSSPHAGVQHFKKCMA